MGLHASYFPISPTLLAEFIASCHSEDFYRRICNFREELIDGGQECYVGTKWHVLDFIINPPNPSIPELIYAVRGREFPASDGSVRPEPHLPSYDDEVWQIVTNVTANEVRVIAQYLPLIDDAEFDSRFVPEKMEGVYRAPLTREGKKEYFEAFSSLRDCYSKAASEGMAILINIS